MSPLSRVVALKTTTPTTYRAVLTIVCTLVAIGISFLLDAPKNIQLGTGAAVAIGVVGLTLLTGWSGQVSIGNSGFVLVGAYSAAIWDFHHTSSPFIISLVMATVVGALSGLLLGIPATRLSGPYLAGATIAFAVVLPSFIAAISSLTQGTTGIFISPLAAPGWFQSFFSGDLASILANTQWTTDVILVAAGIAFFFMSNIFNSKTGRAMRLVRDNDVSAELAGVNLPRTRALAFVISAAYGGLAGGLLLLINQSVNPSSIPFTLSISMLTVMVLGGIGTLSGAIIGGVIYAFSGTFVNWVNSLTGVDPTSNLGTSLKGMLFGGVLILTMLTAPQGLVGGWNHLRRRLARSSE